MNYIYDITLNFNKNNLYEFYEWKEEDDPEFVLKIPMYKVDLKTFLDLKGNDIIIDKKILESLEDKTEVYTPSTISIIRYACVFACDESTIAIEFDSDGNSYMKSALSIEEEIEVIESSKLIKYSILDYKIKNKNKIKNKFITRNEEETEKYLIKKLESMKKNGEESKLKYIFYEIYNEKLTDIDKIYSKLINIAKNDDNKFCRLKGILYLMENKKIMSNNS
ncbi:MAG: hypothetical protein J6J17_03950 [Bacilli bacterium]|nr:hypothetical protein [Bacilli bacterium]